MFCSKCGNKLGEEDAFCSRCGRPVLRVEQPEIVKQAESIESDEQTAQVEQSEQTDKTDQTEKKATDKGTKNEKNTKNGFKKIIFITSILMLMMIGIAISTCFPKDDYNYVLPELPELPDNIMVDVGSDENNYHPVLITDKNELINDARGVSVSENGTIAYQTTEEGEVHVQKDGLESIIPAPVYFFKLSESGEKLVYRTDMDDESDVLCVWDVARKKSKQICNMMAMNIMTYANEEDGGISSDASRIYYYENWDDHTEIGVRINGSDKTISESLPPNTYPTIITSCDDYREILFSCGTEIYYFSLENFELKHVKTLKDNETLYCCDGKITQSITDNIYEHYTEDDTGYSSSSVVWLDKDLAFATLVSDVEYVVRHPQNDKSFWCITGYLSWDEYDEEVYRYGLAYCELTKENDEASYYTNTTLYSDIAVIDGGETGLESIIAVSKDNSEAYVVGEDNTLWKFTPDTIENPIAIEQDVFYVYHNPENTFYAIKKDEDDERLYDDWDEDYGEYDIRDTYNLYAISEDDTLQLEYENVDIMCCTQKNQYFLARTSEDSNQYTLYYKDENGWVALCDNCVFDDMPYFQEIFR